MIIEIIKEMFIGYVLGLGISFILVILYKIPRTLGIVENTAGYQPLGD